MKLSYLAPDYLITLFFLILFNFPSSFPFSFFLIWKEEGRKRREGRLGSIWRKLNYVALENYLITFNFPSSLLLFLFFFLSPSVSSGWRKREGRKARIWMKLNYMALENNLITLFFPLSSTFSFSFPFPLFVCTSCLVWKEEKGGGGRKGGIGEKERLLYFSPLILWTFPFLSLSYFSLVTLCLVWKEEGRKEVEGKEE